MPIVSLPQINLTGAPFAITIPGDPTQWKSLRLFNESPYLLSIPTAVGVDDLQPWTANVFDIADTGGIIQVDNISLPVPLAQQPAVVSYLRVEMADWTANEWPGGNYPMELPRAVQAVQQAGDVFVTRRSLGHGGGLVTDNVNIDGAVQGLRIMFAASTLVIGQGGSVTVLGNTFDGFGQVTYKAINFGGLGSLTEAILAQVFVPVDPQLTPTLQIKYQPQNAGGGDVQVYVAKVYSAGVYQVDANLTGLDNINLSTGEMPVNLVKVGGQTLVIGQRPMANSIPVVLANDQSNVPVNLFLAGVAWPTTGGVPQVDPRPGGVAWPLNSVNVPRLAMTVLSTALALLDLQGLGAGTDTLANATPGLLNAGMLYAYNGTTWDRVRAAAGAGIGGIGMLQVVPYAFDATVGNLGNLYARQIFGNNDGRPLITVPTKEWAIHHNPAVSVKATITKAAGGAGVLNTARRVSFGWSATTALAAIVTLTISLIDGVSGGANVLWQWTFTLPAAVIPAFMSPVFEVNFPGTANTAMTLEQSALITNLMVFVNLGGIQTN